MDSDAMEGARRTKEDDWPEHKKLAEISETERQAVGDFYEWLRCKYEFGEWGRLIDYDRAVHCDTCDDDNCDSHNTHVLVPMHQPNVNAILATYFGIDQNALNREKELMLAGLRLKNHQREVLKKRPRTKVPTGE